MKRISEPRRATLFRDLVHPLLDFVLPSDCIACDRALDARQRMGVCSSCWCGFRRVPRPSCPGCGLPRPESCDLMGPARGLCAACLPSEPRLDAVRAVVIYDELSPGLGARVAFSEGREAAMPFHPRPVPIDAYGAAILDAVRMM